MTTFGATGSPQPEPTEAQMTAPPEFDPKPAETLPHTPSDSQVVNSTEPAPGVIDAELKAELEADQPPPVVPIEPVPAGADVVPAEGSGSAVALFERFDIAETGEVWTHDFLEFEGDKLGIRLPLRQALAAFSLASSKYVSLGVKNDLTGLFIARHLSQESYGRVFSRLMDPDDQAYDVDTVGELFNAIVTAAISADKADGAG